MAKRITLYTPIWSTIAEEYLAAMEEDPAEDVTVRINTPGGSVFAGNGMLAVTSEHEGKVTMKVDGAAMSMGAFLLYYADTVEANDLSRIMIHRADGWVETQEEQDLLDGMNKDLKAQMKKRINGAKFKEVTGHTIDEVFDPTQRLEIWLTAKQAKKVGLVDKINRLKPREQTAMGRMVAHSQFAEEFEEPEAGHKEPDPEEVDFSKVAGAIKINTNH